MSWSRSKINKKRWARVRKRVLERDDYQCQAEGCTTKCVSGPRSNRNDLATVDHITPLSEGGHPYDMDNLQTLCHACHTKKNRGQIAFTKISCVHCRLDFSRKKFAAHMRRKHNIFLTRTLLDNFDYYLNYEHYRDINHKCREKAHDYNSKER